MPNEDSDQTVHLCNLIRIFTGHILEAKFLPADNEDSDQTVWICMVI